MKSFAYQTRFIGQTSYYISENYSPNFPHQRCGVGGSDKSQSHCSPVVYQRDCSETDRQGAPQHSDPASLARPWGSKEAGGCPNKEIYLPVKKSYISLPSHWMKGIKLFTLFVFLLIGGVVNAQQDLNFELTLKRDFQVNSNIDKVRIKAGTKVFISGYRKGVSSSKPELLLNIDNAGYFSSVAILDAADIDVSLLSSEDFWIYHYLKSSAFDLYGRHGKDVDVRLELAEENQSFTGRLTILEDEMTQQYLQSIVLSIAPISVGGISPVTLRARVYKGLEPYVLATGSGDIYLSTGLLSCLRSEEELKALLAIEIAHIYLSHSYVNYRAAIRAQKRAEFWAGFATVAAAGLEALAATSSISAGTFSPLDYALLGNFTYNVSFLSYGLAARAANRLGLEYTPEQRQEALNVALQLMKRLQLDNDHMAVLFKRVEDYRNLESPHRSLNKFSNPYTFLFNHVQGNFKSLLTPETLEHKDKRFLRIVQVANLYAIAQEYQDRNYAWGIQLANMYVQEDIAALEMYFMRNLLLRQSTRDPKVLTAAMNELERFAKNQSQTPIELHKEKALVYLHLGEEKKALESLRVYQSHLLDSGHYLNDPSALQWAEQWIETLK